MISFLYDRAECKPSGGGQNHRCDVILVEVDKMSKDNSIWVIECKSKVEISHAEKAIKQIDGCCDIIHIAKGWKVKKCVIGKQFSNEAVTKLKNKGIMSVVANQSKQCKKIKDVITAVQKIKVR